MQRGATMTPWVFFIGFLFHNALFNAVSVHGLEDSPSSVPAIPIPALPLPSDFLSPVGAPLTTTNEPTTNAPTTLKPMTLAPVTFKPTLEPTNTPTTLEPTPKPTVSPTPVPTVSPTPKPTVPPTISPTESPSVSQLPTVIPSLRPSISKSPSIQPTVRPSTTQFPTITPSDSSAPTSSVQYSRLKMTLVGIRSVEDLSDWESTTASFYENVYNDYNNDESLDGNDRVDNAVVRIRLTSQNTKGSRRTQQQRQQQRMPQQAPSDTSSSVVVTYSQITTYRSRDPNLGTNEILQMPLSTEDYREAYVGELKRSLEGYKDLISVSSISTPFDDNGGGNKAMDGTNDAGGLSMGNTIGIVCGIAAFVLLVGGFVYYRRMDKDGNSAKDENDGSAAAAHNARGIVSVGSSNISTKNTSSKPTDLGDMSVASGDYYPSSGSTPYGNDLDAAEELLTIYAPAGKLGVVIDSPDNGAPMIHDVKDTSPIADKVQVGDRLVAVDDEDARTMTAIKVSKLISRKSSNSRKLTIIRCVVSN
mmetsp:Transcript_43380/g.77958  ORF Transcript_43380/g.77958 Transcript_43380/m.77958 type:complete len:531 (+) Transcript_43380:229-1821(+)